jgi:hypothetical protein
MRPIARNALARLPLSRTACVTKSWPDLSAS